MIRADRHQTLAFRLHSHNLSARLPRGSVLDVAAACGFPDTPPGSAGQSLQARVAGLTPADVDHALDDDKTLMKTWSLRGSPHVFPTRDAAVFTLGLVPPDEEALRFFIRGVERALAATGMGTLWSLIEGELVEVEVRGRVTWLLGRDRGQFEAPPTPGGFGSSLRWTPGSSCAIARPSWRTRRCTPASGGKRGGPASCSSQARWLASGGQGRTVRPCTSPSNRLAGCHAATSTRSRVKHNSWPPSAAAAGPPSPAHD